ncbi:XshC-Cox1 family protein [Micromonospora echinofusca]|uniref:XshC-Cox1 family protein n=1 Tax=Micromonospora echinofusca TaxID=47858 RepID=A0ABS3VIT4_MICEH|nr:XshC-Cox1 family protein [Micromonospora echinofusca]
MHDVLGELVRWWLADQPVAMATVVATWRSAPRQPGATMLVGPDGTAVGSVSGGCVEAAVYDLGLAVTDSGEPRLARYGVSDDDAFEVGLTCGGTVEIFVERIDRASYPEFGQVAEAISAGRPVAVATVVHGDADRLGRRLVVWPDRRAGGLGSTSLDDAVAADVQGMLVGGRNGSLRYGSAGERLGGELTVFVSSFAPPPRMIIFGAIDFGAALARLGGFLGYRVTVCDARPVFATSRRFPGVEVVVDWPHRYLTGEIDAGHVDSRTVVCVLTHDPKFDVPALRVALAQPFAYVGAMGSRRTHTDRVARLRQEGVPPEQLNRLASPIGLDLGGRTPEETAVSIVAEIVARRSGGSGRRLSELDGPVHGQPGSPDGT